MKKKVGLGVLALVAVLVVRQGVVHHWRTSPVGGVWNCKTHEVVDDGCSMAGTCLKCDYACEPGTEPKQDLVLTKGETVDWTTRRCGT